MEDQTVVMPGGAAVDPNSTRQMTVPPSAGYGGPAYGEATQHAIALTCPVCQTPNPPGELFCQDCGLLFSSVSGTVEPLPDTADLARLIDSTGREFLLNPGVNSVGRDSGDIVIADPTISRRHAQVTLEEGRIVIEDLGSTNGSLAAGAPVRAGQPTVVYNGDTVKFGSVSLTVNLPGAGERPAALAPPQPAATEPAADRGPVLAALVLGDGTEYPLYAGSNSIGRRSTNQIVIADAFASGQHADVRTEADGTSTLVDLGSTNGTFVAGERLAAQTPLHLDDGLVVTLGKTPVTFRLKSGGGEEIAPAAPEPEENLNV
jgi:pSer/pThr/pTyr-binding forkhead associated (FHA) protein